MSNLLSECTLLFVKSEKANYFNSMFCRALINLTLFLKLVVVNLFRVHKHCKYDVTCAISYFVLIVIDSIFLIYVLIKCVCSILYMTFIMNKYHTNIEHYWNETGNKTISP